jgi:lysophospholipase L1-like esterase
LDEVLKLTSSSDTIIQVMDYYFPFVAQYKEQGIYGSTKGYWKNFNESITQSAQTREIPAARVFQAFNGRNGEEDPVAKGYIDYDGLHPSEQGYELIAAEFRKLGYQYASQ